MEEFFSPPPCYERLQMAAPWSLTCLSNLCQTPLLCNIIRKIWHCPEKWVKGNIFSFASAESKSVFTFQRCGDKRAASCRVIAWLINNTKYTWLWLHINPASSIRYWASVVAHWRTQGWAVKMFSRPLDLHAESRITHRLIWCRALQCVPQQQDGKML